MLKIENIAKQEAQNMNLSTVRLCFQTYLPDQNGQFVICLKPVYSHPIYDSSKSEQIRSTAVNRVRIGSIKFCLLFLPEAAAASELKICRIDRQSGFVQGGEEVFLLCDKVQKGMSSIDIFHGVFFANLCKRVFMLRCESC